MGPGMFGVAVFAQHVHALISDDRALMERREYTEWRAEQELAALEGEVNMGGKGEIELLEGNFK